MSHYQINKIRFPKRIFIAGSDTGIGKTVVSSILMMGLKGRYWKPVQAGAVPVTDTEWIKEKTELSDDYFLPESYRLSRPLSPHAAAAFDGTTVDLNQISIPEDSNCPHLIIEGAGGLLVPLNDREMMLHLIKQLNVPVILVVKSGLGTINHTLLSLAILKHHDISILGVVMNGRKNEINRRAIESFGSVSVIAEIEPLSSFSPESFQRAFRKYFKEKNPCD